MAADAEDGSLEIRWRPRVASNARRLDEGAYRIVAHATEVLGEAPLARSILRGFVVKHGGGCTKPSRAGSSTKDGQPPNWSYSPDPHLAGGA